MRPFVNALTLCLAVATTAFVPAQAQTQTVPAQGGQEVPIKAVHGAWQVRCYTEADCVMTQLHNRTADTADAVLTIIKPVGLNDPQGQPIEALAEIVVPLGVYLPNGLGLQVDGGQPRAAPYERCIPDGCVVRAPISSGMLAQMKSGGTAYLILSSSPAETIRVPISLNGFTAGFASL